MRDGGVVTAKDSIPIGSSSSHGAFLRSLTEPIGDTLLESIGRLQQTGEVRRRSEKIVSKDPRHFFPTIRVSLKRRLSIKFNMTTFWLSLKSFPSIKL